MAITTSVTPGTPPSTPDQHPTFSHVQRHRRHYSMRDRAWGCAAAAKLAGALTRWQLLAGGEREVTWDVEAALPMIGPLLWWRFEPGNFLQDEALLAPPLTNFGGVANPATPYVDSFTDTNGNLLNDHVADSGHIYGAVSGLVFFDGVVTGNGYAEVYGILGTGGDLNVVLRVNSPGSIIFNWRRQNNGNATGYKLSSDGSTLGLYRMTPSDVLLTNASYSAADNDALSWSMSADGVSHTVTRNGSPFLSYTDATPIVTTSLHCTLLGFVNSGFASVTLAGGAADNVEGLGSAYFEPFVDFSGRSLYLTDADLPTGFPFKGGEDNQEMTICFWYRLDAVYNSTMILGKGYGGASTNSWTFFNNGAMGISKSDGVQSNYYTFRAVEENQWYHVGLTLNGDTGVFRLRVWNETAGEQWIDFYGSFSTPGIQSCGIFWFGGMMRDDLTWDYSGFGDGKVGWLDDVRVYNTALTVEEIDNTRGKEWVYDIYAIADGEDIYKQTGGTGEFVALGQGALNWSWISAAPNGDVYACVWDGDIYKQTGGIGDFVPLGQATRYWSGITASADGHVYACVWGGDIYKQTDGAGNFVAMGQTARNWYGLAADLMGSVYACVDYGDIYICRFGASTFSGFREPHLAWHGLTVAFNGTVYICVEDGDIYARQYLGGGFSALGQTARKWSSISAAPYGDVYACVPDVDIYKRTGESGDFVALGLTPRNWGGIAVRAAQLDV